MHASFSGNTPVRLSIASAGERAVGDVVYISRSDQHLQQAFFTVHIGHIPKGFQEPVYICAQRSTSMVNYVKIQALFVTNSGAQQKRDKSGANNMRQTNFHIPMKETVTFA